MSRGSLITYDWDLGKRTCPPLLQSSSALVMDSESSVVPSLLLSTMHVRFLSGEFWAVTGRADLILWRNVSETVAAQVLERHRAAVSRVADLEEIILRGSRVLRRAVQPAAGRELDQFILLIARTPPSVRHPARRISPACCSAQELRCTLDRDEVDSLDGKFSSRAKPPHFPSFPALLPR